jgi:hypothetical protein
MSKGKVVFATPSLSGPTAPYIKSLEQSIPLITAAGWSEGYVQEIGNAYISMARSELLRRAMKHDADVIVFLDYDLSWRPGNLLTLIETPGDVVAGTYRFKQDEHEYMCAVYSDADHGHRPIGRADGCIKADRVPAGFLKLTRRAIERFAEAYPGLVYGDDEKTAVDLFNHGAHGGVWYGEDYAFCRNWVNCGGEIWLVPDLDISHHIVRPDESGRLVSVAEFPGNFHEFMLRQPGGAKDGNDC